MPSQVGQLSQGPGKNHVADGTQVLEKQTFIVRDLVSAKKLRLHNPFGEWHFVRQNDKARKPSRNP